MHCKGYGRKIVIIMASAWRNRKIMKTWVKVASRANIRKRRVNHSATAFIPAVSCHQPYN
jgi:hypothetical protein